MRFGSVAISFSYILSVFIISVGLIASPSTAHGAELQFAAGGWDDSSRVARLAIRSKEIEALSLPGWLGSPRLYLEGSLNTVKVRKENSATLVALSPVLQWQVAGSERPLFIEAGIGLALIDKTQVGRRNLSSHYQFEDIVRLSWQYSKNSNARIFAMYVHYSNGGLQSPNMGLNLAQIGWAKRF